MQDLFDHLRGYGLFTEHWRHLWRWMMLFLSSLFSFVMNVLCPRIRALVALSSLCCPLDGVLSSGVPFE